MRHLAAGFVLLGALSLGACAGKTPASGATHLELNALPAAPATLLSGTIVSVSAQAVPGAELAWVSGTVKLLGAPVLPMRLDPDGHTWRFRTMVPPLVTVPPGMYQIKAWGRTRSGAPVQGQMTYEVK